jgi:opacity protein-like surface antigen
VGFLLILANAALSRIEAAEGDASRWNVRLDVGGTIPMSTTLTEFPVPVDEETLELAPGFQMDMAVEYQVTPWLGMGPEIGFTANFIDSIGGRSAPNSLLSQLLLMGNIVVQYPPQGPVSPFAGVGAGGVASFLTFTDEDYSGSIYGWDSGNTGSDFVLGYQAFGGMWFRVNDAWTIGVIYRYLQTESQRWNVEWRYGPDFTIGVDSIRLHSICLVASTSF